jgi:hypothetical protein
MSLYNNKFKPSGKKVVMSYHIYLFIIQFNLTLLIINMYVYNNICK